MNREEMVKHDVQLASAGGGDNETALRSVHRKFLVPKIRKAVAAHADLTRGRQTMVRGPNLGHCLFCMAPKNGFYIFMYVRGEKIERIFCDL